VEGGKFEVRSLWPMMKAANASETLLNSHQTSACRPQGTVALASSLLTTDCLCSHISCTQTIIVNGDRCVGTHYEQCNSGLAEGSSSGQTEQNHGEVQSEQPVRQVQAYQLVK
jgi:hypothetical protein